MLIDSSCSMTILSNLLYLLMFAYEITGEMFLLLIHRTIPRHPLYKELHRPD